ncbi:sigma-E factor negative regulatory protein [Methylococcus geothermalis]|uniref:Anti sigma-E protein RseA N-terminal domain-containing protein n=1 Tax=Methylococcus geothermalis TaxID=2681310 RepID=A0A858Q8L8_9GAMM|nr:RseA family anti-sigma factor [Methylococcus geothermalis]QJD30145.1 hypothetical protein GNH96_09300 [Methylococcus geothermalis]
MLDEHMAQKASVFVDNEMGFAEAQDYFRLIEKREDVRSVVSRYYLIGEVLRTGRMPLGGDLADRVARQVAVEPTILAPAMAKSSDTFRRHIVTGALAASLVAMAVFVWRGLSGFTAFDGGPSAGSGMALAEARIDPEMQAYLLAHSGTSHLAGAGTLMPYMRLVSYEQ